MFGGCGGDLEKGGERPGCEEGLPQSRVRALRVLCACLAVLSILEVAGMIVRD